MGNDTIHHTRDVLHLDTYWDDMRFSGQFELNGSSDPTQVQYPANAGAAWRFATGNEMLFGRQMPHWWKVGTAAHLHIHWTPHSRGVAENGNTVNWRADITFCDINSAFTAVMTCDLTATCDGVDDKHLLQEATADIDLSGIAGVSAFVSGRIYRLAGDTWASAVASEQPYLLECDLHLEKDRPGSREEYIK